VIDLSDAGDQVRRATNEPPTARSALERRVRHRRAARLSRRGALAAITMAAAITATVVAVGANHHPATQNVVTTPGVSVPSGPPVILPISPHPSGWVPLDYGRLRLWLPQDWNGDYTTAACSTGPASSGIVLFGPLCDHSQPGGTYVAVNTLTTRPPASWTKKAVNGITIYASAPTDTIPTTTSWDVPTLHVHVSFRGARGEAIARTLGPSSLTAILALHHPLRVPSTWKTVTFGPLTARVPADSVIGQPLPNVGCDGPFSGRQHGTRPNVYLGDKSMPPSSCTAPDASTKLAPAEGLWLQGADIEQIETGTGTITATHEIDGQEATLVSSPNEGPAVQITMDSAGAAVSAVIALGENPVVAEEILSSLTVVSSPKAPPGFVAVGSKSDTTTCTPLSITEGPTTRAVPCPSHTETFPDLVGDLLPTAAGNLSAHNLGVVIRYAHSRTVPRAHIIAMDPAAGTTVPARSIETITSSLGPA
jgi:hypothetical protein